MNHIIKKQILALEVPSGSGSWLFQNHVRDTFNTLVLPRLERVCAELDIDEGVTLKIDKLLIDTGEISSIDMNDSWASEVEAQFRAQLQRLQQPKQAGAGEARIEATSESDLGTLISYLTNGVLPWWISQAHKVSPATLLQKVLNEQPGTFIAALKKAPNKSIIATRIVRQGDDQITHQIFQLIRAQEAAHQLLAQTCQAINIHLPEEHRELLKTTELATIIESKNCTVDTIIQHWHKVLDLFRIFKVKYAEEVSKILSNNVQKSFLLNESGIQFLKSLRRFLAKPGQVFTEKGNTKNLPPDLKKTALKKELFADKSVAENPDKDRQEPSAIDGEIESLEPTQTNTSKTRGQSPQQAESVGPVNESETSPTAETSTPSSNLAHEDINASVKEELNKQHGSRSTKTSAETTQEISEQDQRVFAQIEKIKAQAHQKQSDQAAHPNIHPNPEDAEKPKTAPKTSGALLSSATIADETEITPGRENRNATDKPKTPAEKPYYPFDLSQVEAVEECYVQNAGLVLFWPFLGLFFKNMGLMDSGQFTSLEAQEKAAQLLQYLTTETPDLEEQYLALNKLMVDLPIAHPLPKKLVLSDREKNDCDELLASVVANWSALKGTSIAGFQGSFLHRNGVLKKRENGWLLQVEKKAFDTLLEQLPWPLSIVRLSWMNEPIYVEW